MKQYTKYPNTKRKGGDFNETVETRRKGSTENADETQGQSQNGKTVQTSKSEEKIMANSVEYCKTCKYNMTKKSGGFGKLCNGYTQVKFGRCPEWRISEIIEVTDAAYDRRIDNNSFYKD